MSIFRFLLTKHIFFHYHGNVNLLKIARDPGADSFSLRAWPISRFSLAPQNTREVLFLRKRQVSLDVHKVNPRARPKPETCAVYGRNHVGISCLLFMRTLHIFTRMIWWIWTVGLVFKTYSVEFFIDIVDTHVFKLGIFFYFSCLRGWKLSTRSKGKLSTRFRVYLPPDKKKTYPSFNENILGTKRCRNFFSAFLRKYCVSVAQNMYEKEAYARSQCR